jgi:glycosyltransferase involved in cell wall biosynthesis
LLAAAAPLVTEFPHLRVVIVGKGEPELSTLQQLAQQLGMADRVILPGAIYDEMQLAPWFLSAALFCYPQNVGLSLLHAFGYGLPAVTSDNVAGQNPEIEAFVAGQNGQFYRDGETEDLTRVLRQLLNDHRLRQQLAAGALQTVQDRFSIPRMVDGLEHAIRYAAWRARRG